MDVQLLVTKNDFSTNNIESEFQNIGVAYHVDYIENHTDLIQSHNIRHSPNILINGNLLFRGQPAPKQLSHFFASEAGFGSNKIEPRVYKVGP